MADNGRCPTCHGHACAEGCYPRCRHAHDGPDSHPVCRRCGGTGLNAVAAAVPTEAKENNDGE